MEYDGRSGDGREGITDLHYAFGVLFVIANKLQTLMDREFEPYGLTAKQWLLSIVVDNLFASPPTLKEAAAAMGSTHQNVKQVALKLQRNGYMDISGDERDGRALRLRLTDKSREFWAGMRERGESFMGEVFGGLDEAEMEALRMALGRILLNTERMENGE